MPTYNYLPGVIINTVDGGLATAFAPTSQSTLIIGTSGTGPVNQPTQVTNPASAAALFGLQGDLIRSMEEVLTYSDNVLLFRMGTSPQVLSGVGAHLSSSACTITAVTLSGTTALFTGTNTYLPGDTVTVTITGTDSTLSGTYTVISSAGSTFTVANTTASASITSITGTATAISAYTGFNITFGQVSATANTDYSIWYAEGILAVWYKGNIVYSNSTSYGLVDTGDITLSATIPSTATGLPLGTSTISLANAITVQAASALSVVSPEVAVTLTPCITGLNLTGRQSYIAFKQATELLEGVQVDQIYVPAADINSWNVAFYVSSDSTTANNNPVTNPDALDWLKTTLGNTDTGNVYQWASEVVDSTGASVSAMSGGVTTPAERIAAGFYEVCWGYALATFAADLSGLNSTCMAIIGAFGPKTFKLTDVRKWIGALPTYAADGITPTAYGRGLLGIPYLVGTTSSKLNSLCLDFATGHRLPGFYQNNLEQYDAGANEDINQNPIDIGAYLHVVGDQAILTNSYAANYVANIAGVVAGYLASLDQKSALTNKQLLITQIPGLVYTPAQLDALTQAKINVLRPAYVNAGSTNPALLHDVTAANATSDYTLVLRMRIKGLVVKTMLNRANAYIGQSSLDGLQMQSMQTALDKDLVNLQTRGYISGATVNITSTLSQQRIGHATLYLKFNPANELVQLTAQVGINTSV
jgi:hypothetical protein